jgi:transposase
MFYKNNDSLEGAQKEFRSFFNLGRHGRVPSKHAIKTWIKNSEETGSALKKKPTGRLRSARTPHIIEAVRVSVLRSPRRSVRKPAAAVRLSRECVRRILHVDLKFHPYKLQNVQELKKNYQEYNSFKTLSRSSEKSLLSLLCPSVYLSAPISAGVTGRHFVKFYV